MQIFKLHAVLQEKNMLNILHNLSQNSLFQPKEKFGISSNSSDILRFMKLKVAATKKAVKYFSVTDCPIKVRKHLLFVIHFYSK